MKIFKCDGYTISKNNLEDCIIVEKDNEFYKLDKTTFDSMFKGKDIVWVKTLKNNIIYMLIMIITIIATMIAYFIDSAYVIIDIYFIPATLFLLLNIVFHELGHVLFLKLFYRDSRVKIGFKFVFIYPAFYVDTSYSYLLPKYKRVAVYLAGNFMNCLFVIVILVFFPNYIRYCYLIVSNILINFVPIVKSDGYYAFITMINRFNSEKGKIFSYFDDFIRGLIMFGLLSLLSFISK